MVFDSEELDWSRLCCWALGFTLWIVKNTRFGFEPTKGTTYCNVFAIGLILRRVIRPRCILAFNSGSMQATDILTKLADESRLHYPWIRSLMSRSVYSILMGYLTFLSSLFVCGKQYRSTSTITVYKHRIYKHKRSTRSTRTCPQAG